MGPWGWSGFPCLAAATVLVLSLSGLVFGGTSIWEHDPDTPGDWQDPNNWIPSLPGADDAAYIDNGGTASITSGSVIVKNLRVGNYFIGSIVQSGGTSEVTSFFYLGFDSGSTGTFDLIGGSLVSLYPYVGYYGTGAFNQSGGTYTSGRELTLGFVSGASGIYTLSGGSIGTDRDQNVGLIGTGTFNQSGGTNAVGGSLYLGWYPESNGTYDLSGGSLSSSFQNVGYHAMGSFSQSGGTNTAKKIWVGYGDGSSGTYNLRGGSLTASGPMVLAFGELSAAELKVAKAADVYVEVGGLTINSGGGRSTKVSMEMDANGPSLIRTTGAATLAGTLAVDRTTTAYRPSQGNQFTLILATSGTGNFGSITSNIPGLLLKDPNTPALGYWPAFRGAFDANADYVVTFQGAMPGDIGGDNKVSITDLGDLAAHWGNTSASWSQGDFDGDGQVNVADLGDLATNWGKTGLAPSAAPPEAPVPEPASAVLFVIGVLGLLRTRRGV